MGSEDGKIREEMREGMRWGKDEREGKGQGRVEILGMPLTEWRGEITFPDRRTSATRMWADSQRDGRPAEYRWRPLFNAAKFG